MFELCTFVYKFKTLVGFVDPSNGARWGLGTLFLRITRTSMVCDVPTLWSI